MARVNLNTNSIHTLNRDTGSDPATLTAHTIATGVGNGLEVPYKANNVLLLRNGTANPATVTVKVVNPSQAVAVNVATPDKTIAVAAGQTKLYPMAAIFRQAGECFCQTKPAALINRKERHLKGLPLYFYN